MIHIKDLLERTVERTNKAKFYCHNRDIFLKYFEDCGNYSAETVYDLMIEAGSFDKIEKVIKNKSQFQLKTNNLCEKY